jgi:uncharacterized protein
MRHVPERTCVGCRTKRPKAQLIRVVRGLNGTTIELDHAARRPGRGAYSCAADRCWQEGLRRHAFDKALRVTIPAATREALLQAGPTLGDE